MSIPKIIYLYWDYSKLSFLNYLSIYTVIKYNPEYQIILCRPMYQYNGENTWASNEQAKKYNGIDYIDKLLELNIKQEYIDFKKYGFDNNIPETFKSDIIRLHKLYETGGYWVDSDIIFFKSINSLLINTDIKFAIIKSSHIAQYFIGSTKSNNFLEYVINNLKKYYNPKDYQSIGTCMFNDILLTKNLNNLNKYNIFYINIDLIAPYKFNETKLLFHSNIIKTDKNTLCMHLFNGCNITKEYSQNLTHKNFMNFNNSFTTLIKNNLTNNEIDNLNYNLTDNLTDNLIDNLTDKYN